MELIELLRQQGDLDKARQARNSMRKLFPLTEGRGHSVSLLHPDPILDSLNSLACLLYCHPLLLYLGKGWNMKRVSVTSMYELSQCYFNRHQSDTSAVLLVMLVLLEVVLLLTAFISPCLYFLLSLFSMQNY